MKKCEVESSSTDLEHFSLWHTKVKLGEKALAILSLRRKFRSILPEYVLSISNCDIFNTIALVQLTQRKSHSVFRRFA